jgi:hypothetical protein
MIELYPEKNQIDEQKSAFANAFESIAEMYIDGDEKYFPLRKGLFFLHSNPVLKLNSEFLRNQKHC